MRLSFPGRYRVCQWAVVFALMGASGCFSSDGEKESQKEEGKAGLVETPQAGTSNVPVFVDEGLRKQTKKQIFCKEFSAVFDGDDEARYVYKLIKGQCKKYAESYAQNQHYEFSKVDLLGQSTEIKRVREHNERIKINLLSPIVRERKETHSSQSTWSEWLHNPFTYEIEQEITEYNKTMLKEGSGSAHEKSVGGSLTLAAGGHGFGEVGGEVRFDRKKADHEEINKGIQESCKKSGKLKISPKTSVKIEHSIHKKTYRVTQDKVMIITGNIPVLLKNESEPIVDFFSPSKIFKDRDLISLSPSYKFGEVDDEDDEIKLLKKEKIWIDEPVTSQNIVPYRYFGDQKHKDETEENCIARLGIKSINSNEKVEEEVVVEGDE
jgi:hypothetical protein